MGMTPFGFAQVVVRLERERSYDACVRFAQAAGFPLMEKNGSFELHVPDSSMVMVYFRLDALVDDLVTVGKLALGWA